MDSQTLSGLLNIFTAGITIFVYLFYAYKWRRVAWRVIVCITAVCICSYTIASYTWVLSTADYSTPPPLNTVLLRPIFSFWHCFIIALLVALDIREESMTDVDCRRRVDELEGKLIDKTQAITDRDFAMRLARERITKLETELNTLKQDSGGNR